MRITMGGKDQLELAQFYNVTAFLQITRYYEDFIVKSRLQ